MSGRLSAASIDFAYRRGQPVLRTVTWAPGQRAALLGPNGAGKSTLFGVASGALRSSAGRVVVAGRPVRRGTVAWMPQLVRPMPGLRCREQVALAGWMQGMSRRAAWDAAAEALDAVDLGDRAEEAARRLSGGQLRRLGLAEVLVGAPEVVLLDEPTAGLDPLQRAQVRRLISKLGARRQVIVATHLVEDLASDFDTVSVLLQGRIQFDGSVNEFLAEGSSEGSFAERATSAYETCVSER